MDIVLVGTGYVGLTTGTCLAELGHTVCCYDIDVGRIDRLSKGDIPIFEPELDVLMRRSVAAGRLRFSARMEDCIGRADLVFIAVGTPSMADGAIDLRFVEAAAREIATELKSEAVVVVKSTVVVGTARRVRELIAERRQALDFSVASNPEFLREGSAIADFMQPDRIVVGADDPRGAALLAELYRPLSDRGVPLVTTTTANAELIKYAANAFLALKIGFINDVADLCEKVSGDAASVAAGIGLDHRIGESFLAPGPGFGGSCFPKDTRAFAETGRRHGARQLLIETLIERNEDRKAALARRILAEAKLSRGDTVAVLGVAFKANTDDVRESPALTIIPLLQKAGVSVRAHDPKAMANARRYLDEVEWADCPYEACAGADAVVILTEWDEYRRFNLARLLRGMSGRTLFDYRNVIGAGAAAEIGLRHIGLGRPAPEPVAAKARGDRKVVAAITREPVLQRPAAR